MAERSYWLESARPSSFPTLEGQLACDVVIVGGGIAGITAAYVLKRAGLTVAVVEKNTIASGTTGGTTGKVTTQHGLIYAELERRFGGTFAQHYATLCQQAWDDMRTLIVTEELDCDWHLADSFVYTTEPKKVSQLQREASVAAKLGLPASFETSCALPFTIQGAVKFIDQAYFDAVKYVRGLAECIEGDGSYVFERSEVVRVHEGAPCRVKTRHGEVTATHLIIATKVPAGPSIGRFTYAASEYPVTSYIVAGRYDGDLEGMYISPDTSQYSLLPVDTAEGKLLLVGGESHLPGLKRAEPNHEKLAAYAQRHFGVTDIPYRWKAMDYIAYDNIPLVGKLHHWSKHAYMIGGFKKWGLNLSMVAANVLTRAIVGQDAGALEIFSPHRLSAPISIPRAVVKYFQ